MNDLDTRLARLESELARSRRTSALALAAACVLGLAAFLPQDAPREATTKKARFIDKLVVRELAVEDGEGKVRAILGANEEGGGLVIYSGKGQRTTEIGHTVDGSGAWILSDATGRRAFTATAGATGSGTVACWAGDSKLAEMGSDEGGGGLTTWDRNGIPRVTVGSSTPASGKGGYVAIHNDTGAAAVTLSAGHDQAGVVGVWDEGGNGKRITATR